MNDSKTTVRGLTILQTEEVLEVINCAKIQLLQKKKSLNDRNLELHFVIWREKLQANLRGAPEVDLSAAGSKITLNFSRTSYHKG